MKKTWFGLDKIYLKGTILIEVGKMMVKGGYRIKVLNTINFQKSMHYPEIKANQLNR